AVSTAAASASAAVYPAQTSAATPCGSRSLPGASSGDPPLIAAARPERENFEYESTSDATAGSTTNRKTRTRTTAAIWLRMSAPSATPNAAASAVYTAQPRNSATRSLVGSVAASFDASHG